MIGIAFNHPNFNSIETPDFMSVIFMVKVGNNCNSCNRCNEKQEVM